MDADCSKRVTERDGSSRCYSLVFAGDTWSVAGRQCESRGPSSRLAVVSSATQNDAIAALLQENGLSESWLAASETVHGWQWINGKSAVPVASPSRGVSYMYRRWLQHVA